MLPVLFVCCKLCLTPWLDSLTVDGSKEEGRVDKLLLGCWCYCSLHTAITLLLDC